MNNKMIINTYLSAITLNANVLNFPIKTQMEAEWMTKKEPYICCVEETPFRLKDTQRLTLREWKKIFHKSGKKQTKTGVAILMPDKIDFLKKLYNKRQRRIS